MNIGVDIRCLAHGKSGIARYAREILTALQHTDQENCYFLFERENSNFTILNSRWKKILILSSLPGTFWLNAILPFHFKKYKIDVFWGIEYLAPIFLPARIKKIITVHDLAFLRYPQTLKLTTLLILKFLLKRSMTHCSAVIVPSKIIQQEVSHLNWISSKSIVCIPHGAPNWSIPAEYFPGKRLEHLLFVGNFEPRKNLLNTLKAIAACKKDGLKISLKIVSAASWKNAPALKYINQNGLNEQVEFLGYLTDQDLHKEYLQCKALLFPSMYEGFGFPILEALALDCLILTSHDTSMEEIAASHALYFNPNDPISISNCISLIYKPNFEREAILKDSKSVISNFAWDKSAVQIMEQLRKTTEIR